MLVALPFLGAVTNESLKPDTTNAPAASQLTNSISTALATTDPAPAVQPEAAPATNALTSPAQEATATNAPAATLAEPPADENLVNAAVKTVSAEKPLPPSISLSRPAAEVAKLANSGLDETVMLAFVTNSTSTFSLGAEDIIYLNDIGISGTVVMAMIQRDQALRDMAASAAPAPAAPPPPEPAAPEPAPAPLAPTEMAPQPEYATETYVAPAAGDYNVFYDSLAPYGNWLDVDGYGLCWQPTVVVINPTWRPYCHGGRWLYTDCGWYWMSSYSWGWAPFHYGRWFCHARRGWCWAPGNVWGPSWVTWRYGGNYCGWAPLPPAAGFTAGIGLTYHGARVHSGFTFGLGVDSFSFVAAADFNNHRLDNCAVPRHRAPHVYGQTVPLAAIDGSHSRVVNHGIPAARMASASRAQGRQFSIRETSTHVAANDRRERLDPSSRSLTVYRPQFSPSSTTKPSPAARTSPQISEASRPGSRQITGRSAFTPVTPNPTFTPAPQTAGTTSAAQPTPSTRSQRTISAPSRLDTPRNTSSSAFAPATTAPAVTPTQPTRAPSAATTIRADATPSSPQTIGASSPTTTRPNNRSSSLVIIGRQNSSPRQDSSQPSIRVVETPRAQMTTPQQNVISRPTARPMSESFRSVPAPTQAPAQTHSTTPRAMTPSVRSEQPRSFSAPPSYSARAQAPRVAPTPSSSPTPSRSTPSVSSAPRQSAPPAQPSRSSSSGGQRSSSPGSDRRSR